MAIQATVLEAIETGEVVTRDEIRDYVRRYGDILATNRQIGQFLRSLVSEGKIVEKDDKFMMAGYKPKDAEIVPANPVIERVTLPPFQQKRSGRQLSIEQSPMEIHDVARLQVKREGVWMTMPLFGDMRICLGPDIPRWSPEQETYDEVSCIRIITKDGKTNEMNLDTRNPLTIAPGSSQ